MHSFSKKSFLFCLCFAGVLIPSFAEELTIFTVPEVLVLGDAPGSLTVPGIQAAREELARIPGATAVVDADSFKVGRASTIRDALAFAPGVFVQSRFGAEEARLSIRGSGVQRTFHGRGLMLLIDGVPVNLADGGFDFQAIEPLATNFIEVYRGANALKYGATTLGGAINFVTYTGYDAAPFTARLEYGSFQSFRAQLSSGLVVGPADYYASVTTGLTDGYRDHSKQANFRLFSNIGYRITDELETRFFLTYVLTDSELPGNLTREQFTNNPRQAAANNVLNDWKRDFWLLRLANKTVWQRDDHRVEFNTFWSYKDLNHPIFVVIDQQSNDFGAMLKYDYTGEIFGRPNLFTAGINPTYGATKDNRYVNVRGNSGRQVSTSEQYAFNTNLFIQNSFFLWDNFAVVAGFQAAYARRQNVDNFPVTPFDPDNSGVASYWGYNPQVGLLWDVTETAQVFANIARSFEPPTFGELGNPVDGGAGLISLNAQTATTLETGTRGFFKGLQWDVAWYFSWLENELLEYEVSPGLNRTVNADKTIHQGIELGFDATLWHGLLTRGDGQNSGSLFSYDPMGGSDRILLKQVGLWNDFRFVNDPDFGNNALPGIPPFYYRAELLYEHPSGFFVGPNFEWVPLGYYVDSVNTIQTDPYALWGARIGYRNKSGFSVFFEARNLTNTNYVASTGVIAKQTPFNQAQFLPGDGTGFYGGIQWAW